MGCGWYREAYYPPEARIDRRSVDDLAAELIGELRDGVAGTGVRPGIIGEIGTDKPWVSAQEERVHRAAARAARETGMAITTHGVRSPVALAQLRIFEEEGVDPARVVIGHADSYPVLDHFLAILERGANLQFDFLGHRFQTEEAEEPRLVELIVELLERGCGRAAAAQPGRVPQQPAQGTGRLRLHLPAAALPADPAHRGGRGGGDPADDGRQPAPHPDAALMSRRVARVHQLWRTRAPHRTLARHLTRDVREAVPDEANVGAAALAWRVNRRGRTIPRADVRHRVVSVPSR